MGHHQITVVLCTESHFEFKSRTLVRSIRLRGGALSDARICSFSPRPGHGPSENTLEFFDKQGVEHFDQPLNTDKFVDYPFYNKIAATAFAEEHFPDERLVFFDSDMIVLKDLSLLACSDAPLMLRPVDSTGIGASSKNDPNFDYWKKLWDVAGIEHDVGRITTTLTGESVFNYWNAGLISANRDLFLFSRWNKIFLESWGRKIFPSNRLYMDQSTLAAAVESIGVPVAQLPETYNTPFFEDTLPKISPSVFRDSALIHYHHSLDGMFTAMAFLRMFGKSLTAVEIASIANQSSRNFRRRMLGRVRPGKNHSIAA